MAKKLKTPRGVKYKYKGITFASSFEANIAYTLDKQGIQWEYEPVKIPWEPTVRTRHYTPDFLIKEKDGTEYFLEAKGFFEPTARTKMLAVRKQHPDLDIRFLFMQPNNKIGKMNYREWAEKKGYGIIEMEVQHAEDVQRINPVAPDANGGEAGTRAPSEVKRKTTVGKVSNTSTKAVKSRVGKSKRIPNCLQLSA